MSSSRRSRLESQDNNMQPAEPTNTSLTPQQKSRRRKGSLRKAALLGRGAQRDRREGKGLAINTYQAVSIPYRISQAASNANMTEHDALGLAIADCVMPPPILGSISHPTATTMPVSPTRVTLTSDTSSKQPTTYISTTDEEDALQTQLGPDVSRCGMSTSSGSEGYFASLSTTKRSRSFQQSKSPLSYSGITSTTLPPPNSDWDYSETEWWGWVVLTVTWLVFIVGMGSCLNTWSWAWDVGKTPYAPPELEDDPTLPIVGYYPALLILTCVLAWVWVIVAWVGMKYFRHAKISGD